MTKKQKETYSVRMNLDILNSIEQLLYGKKNAKDIAKTTEKVSIFGMIKFYYDFAIEALQYFNIELYDLSKNEIIKAYPACENTDKEPTFRVSINYKTGYIGLEDIWEDNEFMKLLFKNRKKLKKYKVTLSSGKAISLPAVGIIGNYQLATAMEMLGYVYLAMFDDKFENTERLAKDMLWIGQLKERWEWTMILGKVYHHDTAKPESTLPKALKYGKFYNDLWIDFSRQGFNAIEAKEKALPIVIDEHQKEYDRAIKERSIRNYENKYLKHKRFGKN